MSDFHAKSTLLYIIDSLLEAFIQQENYSAETPYFQKPTGPHIHWSHLIIR